jgi:hypothetical protein
VQTRVIAVDERMGIVWLRMAWGVRERGGDQLTVWEMFKVYDGRSTPWKRSCGSFRSRNATAAGSSWTPHSIPAIVGDPFDLAQRSKRSCST